MDVVTKTCGRCKQKLDLTCFSKDSGSKDKLFSWCKTCVKDNRKLNKESISRQRKIYQEENREVIAKQKKSYQEANKESITKRQKIWYEENKQRIASYRKLYREVNKERFSKEGKLRYEANKDRISKRVKAHRSANKAEYNARASKRRASKLNATPSWLTTEHKEQIRELYEICQAFKLFTGLKYHVDHIIPLVHPLVCGLHVPWNLQILEEKDNLRKNNKFEIE